MTGQEMRALRERRGLTQQQLADILGMTKGHVGQMEREVTGITAQTAARLSEWSDDGMPLGDEQGLDELPEPPYDSGAGPDDEEPESDASPTSPRARAPQVRKLTSIQREAATMLTVLLRGQMIELPDGPPLVMPGAANFVATMWCPVCAHILANAAEPFSVALVRAYPGLAHILAKPEGAKAELVLITVTQIAVPCVMHHLHAEHAEQSANGNGNGGDETA